jgi:hypothetical protein
MLDVSLKNLNLSPHLEFLTESFMYHPSIEYLNLSDNGFLEDHLGSITTIIEKNHSLKVLLYSGNEMTQYSA